MATCLHGVARPPLHLLATQSDLVADLALRIEHREPVLAAMLLDEIERAELHEPDTMPADAVMLGSEVTFLDEGTQQLRTVHLVLPADANIGEGRISILTPMGAALFGVRAGDTIDWPNSHGTERRISIRRVKAPSEAKQNSSRGS